MKGLSFVALVKYPNFTTNTNPIIKLIQITYVFSSTIDDIFIIGFDIFSFVLFYGCVYLSFRAIPYDRFFYGRSGYGITGPNK